VRYSGKQNLDESQKEMARENIGTVGAEEVIGNPAGDWNKGTAEAYIDKEIAKVKNWVSNTPVTDVVVVETLPASGKKNTLYRVKGTNAYSEYGWDGSKFVLLAVKEYGIDDFPTDDSDNLVKSGGVEKRVSLVDVSKQPRVKGFNLFNADFGETEIPGMYFDKNIKGYQFDNNGNYYANANIGISHLIEVKAETKYYSVFAFGSVNNRVMFYDKDLNLISTTQPETNQFTTPEECKYIRFCFVLSAIKSYSYAEGNYAHSSDRYYDEPYNVLLSDFTSYSIASGNIRVQRVGNRYYKSDEKKLYLVTAYTSNTSFVVQEEKMTTDKVYLYNGQSYIYNGTELIKADKIVELSDITMDIRSSGKVNVSGVGDIYLYLPSNTYYIVTSFTNVMNFEVAVYNMLPDTVVRYKNTLFMKDAVQLSKIEDVFIAPTIKTTAASVTQENSIYITTLPNIKQGKIYHFSADISGTPTITITHSSNAYTGGGLQIKNNSYRTRNFRTLEWSNDIPLGFTLANNVSVTIKQNEELHVAECTITSTTGSITVEIPWNGSEGHFVAYMSEGAITNAVLSVSFFDVQKDVWLFGDSYFDIWTMTLAEKVNNNYMLDAYSGRNSNQAMNSLKLDLKYATPKVIVWCMGMNDPDTDSSTINASYKANLDMLISMCNNLGIKLYVTTIPLVPSQYNNAKNAYIESVAPNVVDVNHIVGGDVSTSWYSGLQLDGIHPTELGGKVICNYICACVSEL